MAKQRFQWRILTPRSGGPAFRSKSESMARAKKYRKLMPNYKFRLTPNYAYGEVTKKKYAVEIREPKM